MRISGRLALGGWAEDVGAQVVAGDASGRLDGQAVAGSYLQPTCHPLRDQAGVDVENLGQSNLAPNCTDRFGDLVHAKNLA